MRKRLMAAAAIAPLLIGSQAANAQPTLTISSDTSTPVATATAVTGSPGDIVLQSTFTIKDTTPALTLNSNNNVTASGTITSKNIDNATAISIQGPFSGTVYNSGTISLGEDYTPSDSANNDGITEAPFAKGTGRIGINMTGPLTGAIDNEGAITIQGNNSTAIAIGNTLTGNLTVGGTISMAGDASYAVRTTGEITGNVVVNANVSMKGTGSVGVQTNAPIDGSLKVYGTVATTGYAVTTRETGQTQTNIQKTPADVLQGGSALQIGASVQGGVFLAAPPTNTISTDTTTDADGDGVVDSSEASSSLTTYGSAPTIRIGGPSAINLGNFGSGTNAYGLIIEGTVSAQGIIDGASATAVDIGAGGAGVNLNGGIRVAGPVTAVAYQADAVGIHLEPGVTGGGLFNVGTISASVTSAGANTATALMIDAGSSLGSITNTGAIAAAISGDSANAIAVSDKGGGISSVTNYGTITAYRAPTLPGEALTGQAVALDLRANTTGVTLLQVQDPSVTTTPAISGDVFLSPTGSNTVNLQNGSITGALSMGSAPGSLTIDNGANYTGALTYSGSQLAINVPNGVLNDRSPTAIGASTLNIGGSSTLGVALDPIHNTNTQFKVSGAATFADGAKISATMLSAPNLGGQSFTIVNANSLSVGALGSSLTLPYLFNGSIATTPNAININIITKTPAQMGFNRAETAAFPAIYAALPQDSGVQQAIIGAADRSTLLSAYDQLLPNSSGDVFNTAMGMSRAVSRAASDRFDLSMPRSTDDEEEGDLVVSGFWASEFYSGIQQGKADNNGYHSAALGVIGGYDFGGTGFTLEAASSNITRPGQVGDSLNSVSVFEGGFYAAPRFGALSIDARVGAGYLKVSNRRQLVASITTDDSTTTTNIVRTADGDWSGYDLTAHLGAGLQLDAGKHLFFQPRVYADVFHLHENAYSERNGGSGFDFSVSQRQSTQTNATASMVAGLRYGNLFVLSPQVEVGYNKVVTGGPGDTTARFVYGGPSFTVPANKIDGAATARVTLRGDGNYVHFSLQAGGEYASGYHSLDAKAVFRLTF